MIVPAPLPGRGTRAALTSRVQALSTAVDLADGRLPPEPVSAARAVVARVGERVDLGLERTVVALAGSTGSGKSSLTNALAGTEVSTVGVRRPTTSTTSAAVWPGPDADALLRWLDVAAAVPATAPVSGGADLHGLVLLDLPDDDSTVAAHRVEMERVVAVADVVVWVTDPQKYADRVLHQRYLAAARPLSGSLLVVLNQADRLDEAGRAEVLGHLRDLVDGAGLGVVPVVATSATTGLGLDVLRDRLHETVRARRAALDRLAGDVGEVAERLAWDLPAPGEGPGPEPAGHALGVALREAAGVPALVDAAAASRRREALRTAGWPPLRHWRGLPRDALSPLRLALGVPPRDRTAAATGSRRGSVRVPAASEGDAAPRVVPGVASVEPVALARVEAAVQQLTRETASGLPAPAAERVRSAPPAPQAVADEVVTRVAAAVDDVRAGRPRWPAFLGVLQWLALAALLVGAGWLLLRAGAGLLALGDAVPLPDAGGLPVPTLLLLVGVVGGLVLSAAARTAAERAADTQRRVAEDRLGRAVDGAADDRVLRPLRAELIAMSRLREACTAARGG